MAFLEKRKCERKFIESKVIFSFGNIFYSGNILNISSEGMCIETKNCLPVDSMLTVVIRRNNNFLNLIARVKRLIRNGGFYKGMGLQLITSFKSYDEYVNSLEPAYEN